MQSIIWETNDLWGPSCFSKYSKFYVYHANAVKNSENISWLWDNCILIGCVKHSLLLRENTCQRVSICWETVSRFKILQNRAFRADLLSEWSKNMTKIVPCRFKESFGPFNMFTIHKCSDKGLFRDLSNPAFCSL